MSDAELFRIKENDFNLNIPRYVEPVVEEETITIAEAMANLKSSLNEAYAAEDRLQSLLEQTGLFVGVDHDS
jgi:type I restriction enzyme M protein